VKKRPNRRNVIAEMVVGRFRCFWVVRNVHELLFGDIVSYGVLPALHCALEVPVVWYVRTGLFPEFSCN